MTPQQYHDAVLAEARALVAQGVPTALAVETAHRRVKEVRGPQPTPGASVVAPAMQQMIGGGCS
jgi:hypothetical protein